MDLSFILNHLGEDRENYKFAVAPPVFQSSNFTFRSIEHMRRSLEDELDVPFYSRGCNPTVAILRKKIAALEKAEDCLVMSSGSAAVATTVMSQVKSGDHIICVDKPYSWTNKLIEKLLCRFGVEYTFVDGTNIENIAAARQENTRLLYLESPNSLTFELQDLAACAAFAKRYAITSIIDNSYCSPYFQNPIEFGIDLVVHSATKFIAGHSDLVAGVVCGTKQKIRQIFELEYMTLGGIISAHDAALMIRSLRTLPLRMDRVNQSTQIVVSALQKEAKISKLYYPFVEDSSQWALAKSQMRGAPGLFSIELAAQSIKEVESFCERLRYFLPACSWGGHESLYFPMCVLHQSENYSETTLPWNFIRFYVGLEDPELLLQDIRTSLSYLL